MSKEKKSRGQKGPQSSEEDAAERLAEIGGERGRKRGGGKSESEAERERDRVSALIRGRIPRICAESKFG